jgi:hypothetical protein
MTGLFNEAQFDPVFCGIKSFTCDPPRLKIRQFQGRAIELKFVFGSVDIQRNGFRLGGFGTPIQELKLGIARRNALGIDWASRVFTHLQKQQLRAAGFERNLFADAKNKRLVQRGGRRKPFLRLGNDTQGQQYSNHHSGFHGSRLSAQISIDMRK